MVVSDYAFGLRIEPIFSLITFNITVFRNPFLDLVSSDSEFLSLMLTVVSNLSKLNIKSNELTGCTKRSACRKGTEDEKQIKVKNIHGVVLDLRMESQMILN